jgi:hypothetical protein
MPVTASIVRVNGELWAKVHAEYQMNTTHALGDSYLVQNWGYAALIDPYVTVTVAYDRLDTKYPVPLDATNISLKMDRAELKYTLTEKTYRLVDDNLPELHWRISPVPGDFSVATTNIQYQQQIRSLPIWESTLL